VLIWVTVPFYVRHAVNAVGAAVAEINPLDIIRSFAIIRFANNNASEAFVEMLLYIGSVSFRNCETCYGEVGDDSRAIAENDCGCHCIKCASSVWFKRSPWKWVDFTWSTQDFHKIDLVFRWFLSRNKQQLNLLLYQTRFMLMRKINEVKSLFVSKPVSCSSCASEKSCFFVPDIFFWGGEHSTSF